MRRNWREHIKRLFMVWGVTLCVMLSFSFVDKAVAKQLVKHTDNTFSDFVESQEGVVFDGTGVVDSIVPSLVDMPGNVEHLMPLRSLIIDGSEYQMAVENIIREPGDSVMTIDDIAQGSSVGYLLDPGSKIVSLWILNVDVLEEERKSFGERETPSIYSPLSSEIQKVNGVWVN